MVGVGLELGALAKGCCLDAALCLEVSRKVLSEVDLLRTWLLLVVDNSSS